MKFYKAFRTFRTANTKLTGPISDKVYIDSEGVKARVTMPIEDGKVTFRLNVRFTGEPIWVSTNDLKSLNRLGKLYELENEGGRLVWQGPKQKITMPGLEDTPDSENEFFSPVTESPNYNPGPEAKHILLDGLQYVLRAVSHDDARPVLSAVSFQDSRMVASDNSRVHIAPGDFGTALVARKPLERIKANSMMEHYDGYTVFEYEKEGICVRVRADHIAGSFPKIDGIVPQPKQDTKKRFCMEYDSWLYKARGDGILKVTVSQTKIEFDSRVENLEDIENFEDGIHAVTSIANYGPADETFYFGVQPTFLYDAMQGQKGEIWVYSEKPNAPILVRGRQYEAVIMPISPDYL